LPGRERARKTFGVRFQLCFRFNDSMYSSPTHTCCRYGAITDYNFVMENARAGALEQQTSARSAARSGCYAFHLLRPARYYPRYRIGCGRQPAHSSQVLQYTRRVDEILRREGHDPIFRHFSSRRAALGWGKRCKIRYQCAVIGVRKLGRNIVQFRGQYAIRSS
jgi:hypothetical protein